MKKKKLIIKGIIGIIAGLIIALFLVLGIIGIIIPLMPGWSLLILAIALLTALIPSIRKNSAVRKFLKKIL